MSELNLLEKKDVAEAFEPLEGVTNQDLELGLDSKIKFEVADVQKVKDALVMKIRDEEYPVISRALGEVCRTVGIPQSFAERCPKSLLVPLLDNWYGAGSSGKVRIFLKNEAVIGCTANTPPYHSNMEILEEVEKAVDSSQILGYNTPYSTLSHSMFSFVVDKKIEPKTGDAIYGGIEVQNSIIGERAIEIAPFIFRQVCVNGMVVRENIGSWSRRNEDSEFHSWVGSTARNSLQKIDAEFNKIKGLIEVPVGEKISETMRSLFRKFHIGTRTQQEIVAEAAAMNNGSGPENMYDIWNSITWVAKHSDKLTPASSRDLRLIASDVVKEVSLCPTCRQLVSE